MAAEDIRNIVDRCYGGGGGMGLTPNALDGQNPLSAQLTSGSTSVGPVASPDPAEVIQQLVGRCYAGTPPLVPNTLDQQNPRPVNVVTPPEIDPTPSEVIQQLVGRCYPGLPVLASPKEIPQLDSNALVYDLPFLNILRDQGIDVGDRLIIKTPDPNDPKSYVSLGAKDDCDEVFRLRIRGLLKQLGGWKWQHIQTGEIYYCKDTNRDQNLDWEACVRNTLDCMFRPYLGGKWTPPAQDCDSYYPPKWSANRDRVCVKNCFPERVAIYETVTGTNHSYSRVGSGDPAFYILKDPIENLTVPLFKYYSSSNDDTFLTTNPGQPDSPGAGERATMNASGMVFQEVMGYVFEKPDKMISAMSPDEQAEGLYRFWRGGGGGSFDHMYTIDPEFEDNYPKRLKRRFAYRIPKDPKADIRITIDVEKGSAGYDNALGYYIANKNRPKVGYIVCKSAKSGKNISRVTVPKSILEQYAGGTMGFFLLPNGAGLQSLSKGQQVTFSAQGGGHRADGISTSEGNYALFSDKKWNPNGNKDFTKWKGSNKQMWEDLINGDDDYDDLKLWHKVEWSANGYIFEGIQCYVYGTDRPTPVYRNINPPGCEGRLVESSFKDVVVSRQDCGIQVPTIEYNDTDVECGQCNGGYSTRYNHSQTVTAPKSGTFRVVSMGGITGGVTGDCIKFTLKFTLNGATVFQSQYEARYWPQIGLDLWDGDLNVTAGDIIGFELVSIDNGPPTGSVNPSLALYDQDAQTFDSQFQLSLSTVGADDVIGSAQGAPAINPINTTVTGIISSLGMQFKPYYSKDGEWQPGMDGSDPWKIESPWEEGDPITVVWENNAIRTMHGTLQANPDTLGGENRNYRNPLLPNISGGYIDTGYFWESFNPNDWAARDEYGIDVAVSNHVTSKLGCFNELLNDHLITRFDGMDLGSNATNKLIKNKTPINFAVNNYPWYEFAGAQSDADYSLALYADWNNGTANPNSSAVSFYAPCTFIHDYYLDGDCAEDGSNFANAAKIRVGFTFYLSDTTNQEGTFGVTQLYWQCVIHIIDVLNPGSGYSEGQSFVLQWPPVRRKGRENPAQSPYYPDQEANYLLPTESIAAYYEDGDKVKRVAKESFYQESHNKDSPIWYFSSNRNKHRLKFRITILDT